MAGGNPNVQFTPILTFQVGAGSANDRAKNYNSMDFSVELANIEDGTFGSLVNRARGGLASIKLSSVLRPDADGVHEGELWAALHAGTECTYVFRRDSLTAKSTTNSEYTLTGFVMSSPASSAERGGLIGGAFTFQVNYLKRDDGTTTLEW